MSCQKVLTVHDLKKEILVLMLPLPVCGHISRSVALQHDPLHRRRHLVPERGGRDGREEPDEDAVRVYLGVDAEGGDLLGPVDCLVVHLRQHLELQRLFNRKQSFYSPYLEFDSGLDERGHVGAVEGVEVAGAVLDGAVAAEELVTEVDTDLE